MRLGVLDQSPLRAGATPECALAETVELAVEADALGYSRFWVAEHHNSDGLMGPAPEVLIPRIAAATREIRVGSGGVMLMHYSPYKVAEQFATLEALFPNRIDLGIGRAPGSDGPTAAALSYGNQIGPEYFGARVADLAGWMSGTEPHTAALREIRVSPALDHHPELWLLGSTDQSAQLAAHLGLGFAFAHFIAPEQAERACEIYRRQFRPSASRSAPSVILGTFMLCSESEEELRLMSVCRDLWRARMGSRGQPGPWPSMEEARAAAKDALHDPGPRESHQVIGAPDEVRSRLRTLRTRLDVDEFVLVSITPRFEQRLEGYRLLARAMRDDWRQPDFDSINQL